MKKARAWIGWGGVLVVGCLLGGWLAMSRSSLGGAGLLPRPLASLAIQTTPEGPFTLSVASAPDGPAKQFNGGEPILLEEGDYFVDVVPGSSAYRRKRLKVHLMAGQTLTLPLALWPVE